MKRIRTSTENFFFANSLVNNHLPEAIPTKDYMNRFEETAEVNFGFFDSAVPDYSTYYPDVSQEDLQPKDEDFYTPLVRALSKIILNKYGPIDFSEGTVLRNSVELLSRQSLYANHEVLVGNEVGVVMESVWQNSFTDKKGNVIPSGINARLRIDGKSNPRLVRNMKMDPPAVHSFSVGVTFDWEKSHPKLDESDFWRSLGTFGKDGKLIRRVVTEIQAYHELSLVAHGADPYAQIISEKGINNADYAKRMLKFPTKESEISNTFAFTSEDFINKGHYTDYAKLETIPNNFNSNFNSEHMNELQEFLNSLSQIKALNLGEEEVSQETALTAIQNAVTALADAQGNIQTLTTENTRLIGELETANNAIPADAQPKIEAYEKVLNATKLEATRLYKLSKGDKASTEMVELIANAQTYDAALTFLNQFKKDAESTFTGKCGDCGSLNVTRMSSASGENGVIDPGENQGLDSGDSGEAPKVKSNEEVLASLQRSKYAFNAESLHGKTEQQK